MSLLDRFLRLERPRGPADQAEPDAASADRFAGVERPGTPPDDPRSSGAALERFGPAADPPLELADTSGERRPFTRCMRCGMDHHVLASECAGCGASLGTPAQREFNERLWADRREAVAREERARAERNAVDEQSAAELAAAQRAMGEALARQVGDRERRRLDAELGGWPGLLGSLFGRGRRGR